MPWLSRIVLAVTLACGGLAAGAPLAGASATLPASMASTGDSITQAFDVGWCCVLQDNPQYSWSTGTNGRVDSQYLRLLAQNSAIAGNVYDDAETGAAMADLDGQVKQAAAQHVQYLTVLMGGNDVCTSTIQEMTPTATFQAAFEQALADFAAQDPGALIAVYSIPNVYQLWSLLHTNAQAQATWKNFGICQSMLSRSNTEAQRQQVLSQLEADNTALATTCAQFSQCRWDNLAVFNYAFSVADISPVDYFHPSFTGQNDLAAVTWASGYWGSGGTARQSVVSLPVPMPPARAEWRITFTW